MMPVYRDARTGLDPRYSFLLPFFLQYTGGKGVDDAGLCAASNELGHGLRRPKGMMPSGLPTCCRAADCERYQTTHSLPRSGLWAGRQTKK